MQSHELLLPSVDPALEQALVSRDTWQTEIAARHSIGESPMANIREPLTITNIGNDYIAYQAVRGLLHDGSVEREKAVELQKHIVGVVLGATKNSPPLVGNPFLESEILEPASLINTRPKVLADPKIRELIESRDMSGPHAELLEAWPNFVNTLYVGIDQGIEEGYISKEVIPRFDPALERTSVRVIDGAILNTYSAEPIEAYYLNTKDEIAVRHNLRYGAASIHDALVHEFVHKLSGGTFLAPNTSEQMFVRPRIGYSTEIEPDKPNRVGLNEAITHHITLGILDGDFATIDPDRRAEDDGIYYGYRKVVASFIQKSKGILSLKTMTKAFFEDTGPDERLDARRALVQEINDAYGPGALRKLDSLLSLSEMLTKKDILHQLLPRIHSPVMWADGSILRKGWIDTEIQSLTPPQAKNS